MEKGTANLRVSRFLLPVICDSRCTSSHIFAFKCLTQQLFPTGKKSAAGAKTEKHCLPDDLN